MKTLFLISAFFFAAGIFTPDLARAAGASEVLVLVGERNNDPDSAKTCKDCEEVKKAIRAARMSSGGPSSGKTYRIRDWTNRFSERMHMKMKNMFPHRKKVRTSYEVCFGWH